MTPRIDVPQKIADELMYKSRHMCCICQEKHKHVELHHIDGNNSNNIESNLVVLCKDCHSKVTSSEGLGRRYSNNEVRKYKKSFEKKCKKLFEAKGQTIYENWEDDYITKTEDLEEKLIIKANEHYLCTYDLTERAEIKIFFECEFPLDLVIQNEVDYKFWNDTNIIRAYNHFEGSKFIKGFLFITSKEEGIHIILINKNNFDVEVTFKIKIWE